MSSVAQLLVSVRSAAEAQKAMAGGASIIDVKEPDLGSLGRASFTTWREVRGVVPSEVPLSVALGELSEWRELAPLPPFPSAPFNGLTYCKLGLARSGRDWRKNWLALRETLPTRSCRWIAVAYADWQTAEAPSPDAVLEAAVGVPEIAGVLLDTWSKAAPARPASDWLNWSERVKAANLKLAVAGSLTLETIPSLGDLAPDVIAVRGAACEGGDRQMGIDQRRVSDLAAAVRALGCRS